MTRAADIITRLTVASESGQDKTGHVMDEAATEIARLREALEEIVQIADLIGLNIATIARRALEGK